MSETQLGPFCVCTERTQIAAYKNAVSATGDAIPAAFPICWLAEPTVRAAIEEACRGFMPLHEGQTFEYVAPLQIDAEYRLSIVLEEQTEPARLSLKSEIATPAGQTCLRMETLLRLVSFAGELAA